jgi:hypothetical protein
MRKPISKHALRRALQRVHKSGVIQFDQPLGTVVDLLWHEVEKQAFTPARKKAPGRETVRTAPVAEIEET